MRYALAWTVVCSALVYLTSTSFAVVLPLPSNQSTDINVSNDDGAIFGSGVNDTYHINVPGGELNQLHISTDSTSGGVFGQVTARNITTSSASGTFWVTTTGGRGFNDDIIVMFSLIGPISDDFSLKIKSSGYQWTPSTAGVVNPVYKDGAVDEIFTKADFLYGTQTAKPGPGNAPFYSGQDVNDPSTAQYLMFIDLDVGNDNVRTSIDSGDAKVEFDVSGIYDTVASFNAYAWAFSSNIANNSINLTNNLSTDPAADEQSGYSIATTAVAAVPEPGQGALFVIGLSGILLVRRRRLSRSRSRLARC